MQNPPEEKQATISLRSKIIYWQQPILSSIVFIASVAYIYYKHASTTDQPNDINQESTRLQTAISWAPNILASFSAIEFITSYYKTARAEESAHISMQNRIATGFTHALPTLFAITGTTVGLIAGATLPTSIANQVNHLSSQGLAAINLASRTAIIHDRLASHTNQRITFNSEETSGTITRIQYLANNAEKGTTCLIEITANGLYIAMDYGLAPRNILPSISDENRLYILASIYAGADIIEDRTTTLINGAAFISEKLATISFISPLFSNLEPITIEKSLSSAETIEKKIQEKTEVLKKVKDAVTTKIQTNVREAQEAVKQQTILLIQAANQKIKEAENQAALILQEAQRQSEETNHKIKLMEEEMVKKAEELAASIISDAKQKIKLMEEEAAKLAKEFLEKTEEITDSITHEMQEIGQEITEAAQDVGEGITHAVQVIGDGIAAPFHHDHQIAANDEIEHKSSELDEKPQEKHTKKKHGFLESIVEGAHHMGERISNTFHHKSKDKKISKPEETKKEQQTTASPAKTDKADHGEESQKTGFISLKNQEIKDMQLSISKLGVKQPKSEQEKHKEKIEEIQKNLDHSIEHIKQLEKPEIPSLYSEISPALLSLGAGGLLLFAGLPNYESLPLSGTSSYIADLLFNNGALELF